MAFKIHNNKILKFGSNILNSGELFVLNARGTSFPSLPNGQLILRFNSNAPITVNYGNGNLANFIPTSIGGGEYQVVLSTFTNRYDYPDGLNIDRTVSISFNRDSLVYLQLVNQLLKVSDFVFEFSKYPNLKYFELINENYLTNLNAESILGTQLTTFSIANVFVSSSRLYKIIPIEVLSTPLITLRIGTNGFSTVDFSQSNMDKIINLKTTLKALQIFGTFTDNNFSLGALPSNFNQLNILEDLTIQNSLHTTTPTVINQIPSLKSLTIFFNTSYTSYGDISNLVNLTSLTFTSNSSIQDTLPAYFSNFTLLKALNYRSCFLTVTRVDNYVNSVYNLVDVYGAKTGASSLPFRSMTVNIGTFTSVSAIVSGTYQQPTGYITGVSNGTPSSPREKIWVMVNQYGHVWTYN